MTESLENILKANLPSCGILGIVGAGKRGTLLRKTALRCGYAVMVCDPPRALEDGSDVFDAFLSQWGNGMGGCDFSRDLPPETFLPVSELQKSADLLVFCVPETRTGPCPTAEMIDEAFLNAMRKHTRILNFSGKGIIAKSVSGSVKIVEKIFPTF